MDGTWSWVGLAAGGASLPWSNPTGANWLRNGVAVGANQYPGMAGSTNDVALFNKAFTAGGAVINPATLDVLLPNQLLSLQFTGWTDTLTLNNNLSLTGATGDFLLTDNSTISMAANVRMTLTDLGGGVAGVNYWGNGTITGGANSLFALYGTYLNINSLPTGLGTNLFVTKSLANNGAVELSQMAGNLLLTGTSNYIDVGTGGSLNLDQSVAAGFQDAEGGIALLGGHTGPLAVQVEVGGSLKRFGAPGASNQVLISGAVYNVGGLVEVEGGNLLHITGKDARNFSYWSNGDAAKLQIDNGGNINAAGLYQIDAGTVVLTAPAGGKADELDGAGLYFGNATKAFLTIVDATPGTPGTVTVQGPVTLNANTKVTMNFVGATSKEDLLDVQNGALTLAGTLNLVASDGKKPGLPLVLFDDAGATAAINGNFGTITDNVGGTDFGRTTGDPPLVHYFVTIV